VASLASLTRYLFLMRSIVSRAYLICELHELARRSAFIVPRMFLCLMNGVTRLSRGAIG
jgi:hypothetical protein